ncbi:BglG family transcription antiterminator LicT [Paenibacillus lentus]|uniref:PRD domain-containing protein n=1 Tax=Paenibacillus lentus TaxID=1338368 RepID=A0A3Q8S8V9_9BACL|nr:PRD domain-containing protein [Paenibacillus lentus]AZK45127.1 PRD domain-containing protein [Paenibacillus lentus]
MKIKKIFNNNVILLVDDNGDEMIVMGKGIGYNKHNSSTVDFSQVDKRFVLEKGVSDKLIGLVSEIPTEHLELSNEIIEYAEQQLSVKFSDNIYITLTDHISFALTRFPEGLFVKNALLWEIKQFYKAEFEVALKSLDIIETKMGVRLPEDEAGSIALHFVNAQQKGQDMKQTYTMTKIVNDLSNIVKYHFGIKIDESSINYSRFLTHLRYFAYRVLHDELIPDESDSLFEHVRDKYPESYACAKKMIHYFENNYSKKLTNEELVYFIIHIHRVTSREN